MTVTEVRAVDAGEDAGWHERRNARIPSEIIAILGGDGAADPAVAYPLR